VKEMGVVPLLVHHQTISVIIYLSIVIVLASVLIKRERGVLVLKTGNVLMIFVMVKNVVFRVNMMGYIMVLVQEFVMLITVVVWQFICMNVDQQMVNGRMCNFVIMVVKMELVKRQRLQLHQHRLVLVLPLIVGIVAQFLTVLQLVVNGITVEITVLKR